MVAHIIKMRSIKELLSVELAGLVLALYQRVKFPVLDLFVIQQLAPTKGSKLNKFCDYILP